MAGAQPWTGEACCGWGAKGAGALAVVASASTKEAEAGLQRTPGPCTRIGMTAASLTDGGFYMPGPGRIDRVDPAGQRGSVACCRTAFFFFSNPLFSILSTQLLVYTKGKGTALIIND